MCAATVTFSKTDAKGHGASVPTQLPIGGVCLGLPASPPQLFYPITSCLRCCKLACGLLENQQLLVLDDARAHLVPLMVGLIAFQENAAPDCKA